MDWLAGIDAAFSRITRPMFRRFKEYGWSVFTQNLWTGGYAVNDAIRRVAEPNLTDAMEEGLVAWGYSNANPWYPPERSVAETRRNAGGLWSVIPAVQVDAELEGITVDDINDLALALEQERKETSLYTAWWVYNRDGAPDWSKLARLGQWLADYSHPPGVVLQPIPGPKPVVVGHQWRGTSDPYGMGIDVDLNIFRKDWVMGLLEEDVRRIVQEEMARPLNFLGQELQEDVLQPDLTYKKERTSLLAHTLRDVLRLLRHQHKVVLE